MIRGFGGPCPAEQTRLSAKNWPHEPGPAIMRFFASKGRKPNMRKFIQVLAGLTALIVLSTAAVAQETPKALIETSMGEIHLELYPEQAPETVANFIEYANSGYYDGTIFHRVISSFMIQGGGFTPDMERKNTREPIRNEAANGLSNTRGTIAMARTADPHSATAQFFINVVDNPNLDYSGEATSSAWG